MLYTYNLTGVNGLHDPEISKRAQADVELDYHTDVIKEVESRFC